MVLHSGEPEQRRRVELNLKNFSAFSIEAIFCFLIEACFVLRHKMFDYKKEFQNFHKGTGSRTNRIHPNSSESKSHIMEFEQPHHEHLVVRVEFTESAKYLQNKSSSGSSELFRTFQFQIRAVEDLKGNHLWEERLLCYCVNRIRQVSDLPVSSRVFGQTYGRCLTVDRAYAGSGPVAAERKHKGVLFWKSTIW